MTHNLYSRFRARFIATPDHPFIIRPDGSHISYAELDRGTAQIANFFRELAIMPGDRIAVHAEKSAESLLLYLATLRIGAVYLPLNPAYTTHELRYFLNDAAPALFITDSVKLVEMAEICNDLAIPHRHSLDADGNGSLIDAAAHCASDFTDIARAADDLAAILYTSGTTGLSKGAMLSHDNLWSNCETLREYWHFSSNDRLLHALPIFHTHGLFVATNVTLASGGALILMPRFDVDELVRLMPSATVLMGVPTFYTRLLAAPGFTHQYTQHMRLFISGSAPLSAEVHREFSIRSGHHILERYGMTETNMITSNPYDGTRIPGSVGLPLPGVEVRIGNVQSEDQSIGVIEVRGPNVFSGYWQMPEKTAAEFRDDGFFITGDMGRIDEQGYVHIVGREKDLIISGGFNIYPAEVEAIIDTYPGVAESAVIGVPHRDFGEAVVALIRTRGNDIDEAAIMAALADKLARYKQPKKIVFLPDLPRNAMGKIEKKKLREQYSEILAVH